MSLVRLGDIVDFHSGGTPSKTNAAYWAGETPWFSAKDLKQRRLADSIDHISEIVFTETSIRKLPAGTVVLVVRGMILAHTVPICVMDVDGAINQDLKALRPRDTSIHSLYLASMLRARHEDLLARVGTAGHGTKKLETRVLANLEIPLPTLGEQHRISGLIAKAEAGLSSAQSLVQLHTELINSLEVRAYEGRL